MSCEMEINPKWKHAIDMNVCPFCGQNIMDDLLKNLFTTLRETMDKLGEYPDQLNDWMLSNHNYIKTDSPLLVNYLPEHYVSEPIKEPVREDKKFIVTVKTESGEQEVIAEKIQEDSKTNEFFKRAEIIKPGGDGFQSPSERNDHLKKMVQQIKRSGSTTVDEKGTVSSIPPEMIDSADPEAIAEYMSLMSDDNLVSSSLPSADIDGDEIPPIVLNMANQAVKSGGSNSKDLLKLQQMHDRVNESRRNFESGAKGKFSRSS